MGSLAGISTEQVCSALDRWRQMSTARQTQLVLPSGQSASLDELMALVQGAIAGLDLPVVEPKEKAHELASATNVAVLKRKLIGKALRAEPAPTERTPFHPPPLPAHDSAFEAVPVAADAELADQPLAPPPPPPPPPLEPLEPLERLEPLEPLEVGSTVASAPAAELTDGDPLTGAAD